MSVPRSFKCLYLRKFCIVSKEAGRKHYSPFIRREADDAIPLVSSALGGGEGCTFKPAAHFRFSSDANFVARNVFLESDGVDGFYVRNGVDGRLGVRKGSTIRSSMLFIFHTDDP